MFSGTPQSQGLLAAAAQILQASGPSRTPTSLGQILGSGLSAYQQQEQQARQFGQIEQLRGVQLQEAQASMADRQRARELDQQTDDALRGGISASGLDAKTLETVMRINPRYGMELQRSMAKAAPKFDSGIEFVDGPDGKPIAVRTADDGSVKLLDGLAPREKLQLENLGGRSVAVNPYELQPGQSFQRTMTPGEIASNGIARANLGLSRERLQFDKQYKAAAEARAEKELALKQQIGKAPTEFQGKSAAFGLRADEADKILSSLDYSPAAINAKTSVAEWPIIGGALGAATNKLALNESDQKAEQSQRDFINAVLRQESGAAIADSEFDNARKQYFPQPGDSQAVIAQKARTRQLSIQGLKNNAGRAAMTASPAPVARQAAPLKSAMKGQVMDGYRFKGGDPSDPNAWEKL